jgi:hypothetical protein
MLGFDNVSQEKALHLSVSSEMLLIFVLQCEYVEEIFLELEVNTNLRVAFTQC